MCKAILFCAGLISLTTLGINSIAATYYVNPGESIQDAIDSATHGDTVIVSQGTFYENINFNGKNILLTSTNPYSPSIVQATIINSTDSEPVVTFSSGEDMACVIEGFTITNASNTEGKGGGVYCYNTSPTLKNCIFKDNSARYGGGIYSYGGAPVLESCEFIRNAADYYGGGAYSTNNILTLKYCTFIDNAAGEGGGICANDSSLTMTYCTLVGNSTSSEWYRGGGIYNLYGSSTLTSCIFSGNSAGFGGGMFNSRGSVTLDYCRFSGNQANHDGGAIYNLGILEPASCILTGNIAQCGGGIYNSYEDSLRLLNCTVVDNAGCGLYMNDNNGTVTNCIFWGNTCSGASIEDAQFMGESPIVTYSCIQDASSNDAFVYPGVGNIDDDPLFEGYPVIAGTWSQDAVYNPETGKSRMVIDVDIDEFDLYGTGIMLNPNTNKPKQYCVADSTETTITVWGNVGSKIQAGKNYEVYGYALDWSSPCADRGDVFVDVAGGNSRYFDKENGLMWDGTIKGLRKNKDGSITIAWKSIDMGAYECYAVCLCCVTFYLQASDDLKSGTWQNLYQGGKGNFCDTGAITSPNRFYRIKEDSCYSYPPQEPPAP